MRYILDSDGYIEEISFGAEIICNDKNCTEYTGTIPNKYESLLEWAENANIRAYKIVENNLVYDAARDSELQVIFEQEEIDNTPILHKDMYELEQQVQDIQNVNNSQYLKSKARGKIVTVDNVKTCFPNIKLTNIDCYSFDKIDFIVTGKNMLPNTAITQVIEDVVFIQNEDRSITINGTATADIEYNITGTSTNTSPFLCFKKNVTYYLSSNGYRIKMYYFDGTDRTEVYNGLGGSITFTDDDKPITQVVLSMTHGTTISNKTIYPMLNLGTTPLKYEIYKSKELRFNFSKLIEDGLFPSDDLYPSDDLFPQGTTIDYITIENGFIDVMCNEVLRILDNGYLGLFDGYNIVYTIQDTTIEMEYCIDILDVESLEFLQGKATTTNRFKILEDGSIEAHNGFFSGTVSGSEFKGSSNDSISLKIGTDSDGGMYTDNALELDHIDGSRVLGVYGKYWNTDEVKTTYITSELGRFAFISKDYVGGTLFASSYDNFSLEEMKKNITKFNQGLSLIKNADIYKYNYNNEKDEDRKHIGLVIGNKYNTPCEVLNNENTGVDLYSMIGVAWQSIKELNAKIEQLEEKIKELESDKNGKN